MDVLEVDAGGDHYAWGKFLRVCVLLTVTTPLCRGVRLRLSDGHTILVMIRYERLPILCFVCGRLDHHESECETAVKMWKVHGSVTKEYGHWMCAENPMGVKSSFNPSSMMAMGIQTHMAPIRGESSKGTCMDGCVVVTPVATLHEVRDETVIRGKSIISTPCSYPAVTETEKNVEAGPSIVRKDMGFIFGSLPNHNLEPMGQIDGLIGTLHDNGFLVEKKQHRESSLTMKVTGDMLLVETDPWGQSRQQP
ncbi:hypothetical protein REPUB_Repub05bG0203000 [Reevesia pubescens]